MRPVATVVAADDEMVRERTGRALSVTGRIKIVGSVADPSQALTGLREPFDVLLYCILNDQIPTDRARPTHRPPPYWLIAAERASAALAQACVGLRASSVIPVRSAEQLAAAVELSAQGFEFHGADLIRMLPQRRGSDSWTETDVQILLLLRQGEPLQRIAHRLHYSQGAARNICSRLYRRLGVRNRFQAVREARRIGLL